MLFKKLSLSVALLMSLSNIVMAEAGAESYIANIDKKIIMSGQGNNFELWDEHTWHEQLVPQ
jgi:DNA-binding transcriptional regulator/RsmH inhibitor MraZ